MLPAARRGPLAWVRGRSLWVMVVGTGCCTDSGRGLELTATGRGPRGVRLCQAPEQADVLLVMGPIGLKLVPELRRLHARMARPAWVVAAGACACGGAGMVTYAALQGVDSCLPVDLFVPGCPPAAADLLAGLESLGGRPRT